MSGEWISSINCEEPKINVDKAYKQDMHIGMKHSV